MLPITIRAARETDLDTLLRFEQGVVQAERPFDPTLKEDPIHYYDLRGMLKAEDAQILLAEDGNKPVGSGYALIQQAKQYLKHKQYAYLGFMYVDPTYRGRGINRLIIDGLVAWAATKDISEIRLDVYNRNEPAIRAYEKAGFVGNLLEMRLNR